MIKTRLTTVEKTLDEATNSLVVKEKDITVTVDTSIFAEERWETNFPHNAIKETLFTYIERVKKNGQVDSHTHILSNLKALYCFIESSEIADFKSFCQLFDLADIERLKKLVAQIKYVFDLALSTSAVSEKN